MSDEKTLSFSKRTQAILKNFSSINPSMLLEASKVDGAGKEVKIIRTAAADGSILVIADIDESIPFRFPIMDLASFMSILGLPAFSGDDCILKMDEKKIVLEGKKSRMRFWSTAESLVELPDEELELPEGEIKGVIEGAQLTEIIKASSTLKHPIVKIRNRGGKVFATATTPAIDTSNDYEIELGVTELPDAEVTIKTSSLVMINGDYKFEGSGENNFIKFTTMDDRITYVIGGEIED